MFAVKVGDEVGMSTFGGHGWYTGSFGTVTKVNGHGHIFVTRGETVECFDKHGKSRAQYSRMELLPASQLREHNAQRDARLASDQRRRTLETAVQELTKYSRMEVTAEMKANLVAMVNAL